MCVPIVPAANAWEGFISVRVVKASALKAKKKD
jgi:hypothetical protein